MRRLTLEQLFEYQNFAPNPELQEMILSAQNRYLKGRQVLDDEEAELVAAAGTGSEWKYHPEEKLWKKDTETIFSKE